MKKATLKKVLSHYRKAKNLHIARNGKVLYISDGYTAVAMHSDTYHDYICGDDFPKVEDGVTLVRYHSGESFRRIDRDIPGLVSKYLKADGAAYPSNFVYCNDNGNIRFFHVGDKMVCINDEYYELTESLEPYAWYGGKYSIDPVYCVCGWCEFLIMPIRSTKSPEQWAALFKHSIGI